VSRYTSATHSSKLPDLDDDAAGGVSAELKLPFALRGSGGTIDSVDRLSCCSSAFGPSIDGSSVHSVPELPLGVPPHHPNMARGCISLKALTASALSFSVTWPDVLRVLDLAVAVRVAPLAAFCASHVFANPEVWLYKALVSGQDFNRLCQYFAHAHRLRFHAARTGCVSAARTRLLAATAVSIPRISRL